MTVNNDELTSTQSPLEYRPDFKTAERERTAWEVSPVDDDIVDSETEADIGTGIITDIIKDYEDVKDTLAEKVKEKEKELKYEHFPIPPAYADLVSDAKEKLGRPGDDLTIDDYKEALRHPDTPAGDFLLDVIERHAEDIDGDIRVETYGDYVELLRETELIDKYIQAFIYPVIDYQPDGDSEWLSDLENSEHKWHQRQTKRDETYRQAKDAYKNSYLYRRNSLMSARGQLHSAEKDKDLARHQYTLLTNSATVVVQKTRAIQQLFSELDELENLEPDMTTAANELLELAESNKESIQTLDDINLYLKLSVDDHNKVKGKHKHSLRTTYGMEKQEKILDEHALQTKAFSSKGLNVAHYMRAFQHTLSPATESVLNEMANGLSVNAKQMKDKTYEFYTLQQACARLRQQKIDDTRQKHLARMGYKGFAGRIREIQTGEE